MKLKQNAREIVLAEIDGLGLIMGEIRYNRQTETVIFALEKGAFFDLYFPCAIVYDQQRGPVVHPHLLTALTTSSIRVQRSKVSCFILEHDINPEVFKQYQDIVMAVTARQDMAGRVLKEEKPDRPDPQGGGPRVIPIDRKKGK
jgi:hypothetical protein